MVSWQGPEEKETLAHCWWESKLEQPLWKTVWRFFNKLKVGLPYNSEIPLPGIYAKEIKSLTQKDNLYSQALFIIAKTWKPFSVHQQING